MATAAEHELDESQKEQQQTVNASAREDCSENTKMEIETPKPEGDTIEESIKEKSGLERSSLESGFTSRFTPMEEDDAEEPKNEEASDDALSASASATLDHPKDLIEENRLPKKLTKELPEIKKTENNTVDVIDKETWHTVGFIKGNSFDVQNYIAFNEDISGITVDNLPDLSGFERLTLEPGTAYRFRVAAVNSLGVGDWSDVSAFKTCVPGFPGAPSAIKITKSADGAHLSWEPPSTSQGDIVEYSVYLAVQAKEKTNPLGQFDFVRVYCGPGNSCVVPNSSLASAYLDTSTRPAIILRIAAKNKKGYGPSTQVRWLQDPRSVNKILKPLPEGEQPTPKKMKFDKGEM